MDEEEECDCEEGAPAWMATFSDMATLLLTFFVLLLSFANMDIQNFKMALGSVKEAFGVNFEVNGDFEARSNSIVELSDVPATALSTKEQREYNEITDLRRYIRHHNMQNRIDVMGTQVGIVLRVKDVALFDVGSDTLREDSAPVLDLVLDLFVKSRTVLSIEGHTDNVPIARMRFPSNWELSAARAAAVLRHFISKNADKARLSLAGYGEMRPIASNETAEGRAKNRRVEFVFRRGRGQTGRMFHLGNSSFTPEDPDLAQSVTANDDSQSAQEDDETDQTDEGTAQTKDVDAKDTQTKDVKTKDVETRDAPDVARP